MKKWKIGEGYEQESPGLFVYDDGTKRVVVSEFDPPRPEDMERIALCIQMCDGLSIESMKRAIDARVGAVCA